MYSDISNAATGLKWSMYFLNEPWMLGLTGSKRSLVAQFSQHYSGWPLRGQTRACLESLETPHIKVLSRYSLNPQYLLRPQCLGSQSHICQAGPVDLITFALKKKKSITVFHWQCFWNLWMTFCPRLYPFSYPCDDKHLILRVLNQSTSNTMKGSDGFPL